MFEGLVRQLLLGYLGRYIKDIHKDQLKITVWNEEVLLENVELILEAFEYLQLPFAIKQGRVGRLSIKIPWKKLGRESIIITLEDVFICVSQRNDQEWSSDSVEKREFAGKKAKLAAAELAKLSRRVCDSPAGNPFMSYIAAKILDSIQVSIRNFHVLYSDAQPNSVRVILGLRFSSLTVSKQNPVWPSVGRVKGGQVNKLVVIEALEIYCDTYEGNIDFQSVNSKGAFDVWFNLRLQRNKIGHLLKPVHVCVTLLVNRSGELDDDQPQYSISAELTDVVMTLNEFQWQQILLLLDYLQTSQLRERYGRYRPSSKSLSRKLPGWQKLWWHYAQESILFDVRKKLRKTSWRFLGQRLSKRRMYINLYKTKLEYLRREQPIDETVLLGLEEVEKESDIDDILSYRSVAEGEMQGSLSDINMNMGAYGGFASEKQHSDDRSSYRSRGWLNWLSRGMLGAGGTDDSSQFSGVVSDEIIKDIHEATEFHPLSSSRGNMSASDKICTCSMKLNIRKISTILQSVYGDSCQVVAELDILGVVVDCKFWKGFTAITSSVVSGRLIYPQNGKEILTMKGACSESNALELKPSYRVQVELFQDHDFSSALKVTLQPLEITYDVDFFLAVVKFFSGSRSFKLLHERVLSSLNGLDDKTRLTAKATYLLSSRNKVKWDVNVKNITLTIPGQINEPESYNMVFVLGSLHLKSNILDPLNPNPRTQSYIMDGFQSLVTSIDGLQIKDLYDHFVINLWDLEMRVSKSHPPQVVSVLERSSVSINLASCIVEEEPGLKQLEVHASLYTIDVHFSPLVCQAVMSVIRYLDSRDLGAPNTTHDVSPVFHFTMNANLELLRLHVDLGNHEENSTKLIVSLHNLDLWYSVAKFEEWSICMKALEISANSSEDRADCRNLCSSGNLLTPSPASGEGADVKCSDLININDNGTLEDCIRLHCKAFRSADFVRHKYEINWRKAELHCYPYIFALLVGFFGKISSADKNLARLDREGNTTNEMPKVGFKRFGFSNFIDNSSCGCIPMDRYPFITIYNTGSLASLENSLCYSVPDWRKIFSLRNKEEKGDIRIDRESESLLGQGNLFTIEAHLFDVCVHFHDSSSVLGTIILPVSEYIVTISDDHVDLVSSAKDLMLKSPLWPDPLDGVFWGPSLSSVSPVLNLRVRKGNFESSCSEKFEVSIGIQHSCCILIPDYLAIIIGYFSLPDWTSKRAPQSMFQTTEVTYTSPELAVAYTIEIVDSTLILPVENEDGQHLKVDIPQLYLNFIPECSLNNVAQHIPQECLIPLNKAPGSIDCLNIFGRDLSLLYGRLRDKHDSVCSSIILASSVSADAWIRIPCDRYSSSSMTCVMTRVEACEIIADDSDALHGFLAFFDVIDHISVVDEESKLFISDVPQFLHAKRHLKQEKAVVPLESFTRSVEIRCFVNLFRMKLHRASEEAELAKPVLQADTKFIFSGRFENNLPRSLEAQFFYVGFCSLLNSVVLAQCVSPYEDSSVLGVRFNERNQYDYELCLSLSCLDIWLHSFDWTEVIDLLISCAKKLEDNVHGDFMSKGSNSDTFDYMEAVRSGSGSSEISNRGMTILLKSENIGVRIHFPLYNNGTWSLERFEDDNASTLKEKNGKYLTITALNTSGKLFLHGGNVEVSCKFEKLNGIVAISKVESVESWSLFGVEQLDIETEIQMDLGKIVNVNTRILSDHVEMHVSHKVLSFWHGVVSDGPKMVSSRSKQGNMSVIVQIRDASVFISDGRRGCSGLLLEALIRNFSLHANVTEKNVEGSVSCDIEVNYNNMHKVVWEPFIEPWNFDIKLVRVFEINALMDNYGPTEVIVASSAQLNINLTESLFECIFRTIEMIKDAWGLMEPDGLSKDKGLSLPQGIRSSCEKLYAPYILQNLTSLPLVYQVFQGHNSNVLDSSAVDQNFVQPGASVPIYLNDNDKQWFDHRDHHGYSSRKQSDGVTHHYMRVQLDGTYVPSPTYSMDRIGLSYFEVDFSKTSSDNTRVEEAGKAGLTNSFVTPAVFEVSLQRQSKLIRVYSTVMILNSTFMPLELRFDIPFGVSPKILDPISPGQEFPLPLHLVEGGRMRWRPLGESYLWSEAHSISKLLSQKSKIGFRRSFACYPCHPSNEPFRCCISVHSISLPTSFHMNDYDLPERRRSHDVDRFQERFIHRMTLSTPLVVRNCLPEPISLAVGVNQAALLSEGDTPFHHIDPSHDLALEFNMHGFRPVCLRFPRSETFSTVAKLNGGKFSQIETLSFDSDLRGGSIYVSFEKTLDVTCGAREVVVFVPFLLYNCTGAPLIVSDCTKEAKSTSSVIPSCYNVFEQHFVPNQKEGLGIFSCETDLLGRASNADDPTSPCSSEQEVHFPADKRDSGIGEKRNMSSKSLREACFLGNECGKVKACIYSPCPVSSISDIMIRIKRGLPGSDNANMLHSIWSAPFSLVGSTTVVVPQSSPSEASLLSVTCSILGGAFAGRTQAITFQPRYIICNSCSKDLCYKQKGTNSISHLTVRQHSQLHWTETTRELLVSIRFNEPGWQWSGCFLPDHLGDTQLKMRNYVTGALNMVRVEVQNADISSGDEKITGSIHGNVGTNLILLSDDDTGYMPYRIDNFSKERLRVYQQKCETFDTIVHPYTSCPYAWDEPCYPHRLTIEVPGDRVLGSYALEITKKPIPVHLRATSEKSERTLLLSISAEGATKVLSVVDSGYHAMKDIKENFSSRFQDKRNQKRPKSNASRCTEKFMLLLPSIGISLVNSQPQELVYACVSNVVLDLNQNADQQNLSFQMSSLQIDNPLNNSSYPVILSFNHEHNRGFSPDWSIKDTKAKASGELVQQTRSKTHETVLYASIAKWRRKDVSLVSFEHINLRIADFCLELELEMILSLLEFVKAVLPNSQSRLLPLSDPTLHPLIYDTSSANDSSVEHGPLHARNIPVFNKTQRIIVSFPSIVPIGAPWQRIHLLARRHRKIYVETFDLAPVKFTLSFSSAPWMRGNGALTSGESLIHRGLMALADVEGARIHLKQLTISHHMSSRESFQEILIGHYTRQILHEIYKVFGSAGVIGNPMGFARNVALGFKDFLSAPARSVSKSPTGLIQGMAQGTTSLLSSTVYALSDAATQFSKAAHKGIVAFTFDDHDVARMERQQKGERSQSKGVIGEVFEGLTGLLESPIRGAEKHGLPGVISGIALGITGLVARPTASILEVTGKTAQSIRNRSRLHNTRSQRHRLRLPRPLSREYPLRPYSWEEAVGTDVLAEVGDDLKLKGETLVKCKALKQGGDFVVVTRRLVLVVSSHGLVDFRKPGFKGVAIDLEWKIEREISLESVIHVDSKGGVVHIVGTSSDSVWNLRQNQQKKGGKRWSPSGSSALPLVQTSLELPTEEEAGELLGVVLSAIEAVKNSGCHNRFVLHQSSIR